jgi:hypothetical protein
MGAAEWWARKMENLYTFPSRKLRNLVRKLIVEYRIEKRSINLFSIQYSTINLDYSIASTLNFLRKSEVFGRSNELDEL